MIQFQDFVPRMHAAPGIFREGEFQTFEEAVAAANKWIQANHVQVINVETVVLPNIWSRYEDGSADVSLGTSGDSPSRWHQFVRCWYRVEAS
jgi:hypothetical protein